MLDWAITIGLMLCILVGGAMSAAQTTEFFTKNIPEPLRSQQTMQVGLAWLLASIVPFWRSHPAVGAFAFLLGLVTFFQGCTRLYQFGKEKARAERLATLAANDAKIDTSEPMLTGKAASKRRRRSARKAAALSNNNSAE